MRKSMHNMQSKEFKLTLSTYQIKFQKNFHVYFDNFNLKYLCIRDLYVGERLQ